MDLTPDELRKVTFRSTTLAKGYSVTDVDEFVEQVAAGIGELLDQLRSATERVGRAESSLAESRTSEETVQRTLLHAQKLADAVLAEARQEAATIGAEAVESANRARVKAREEGAAHVSKAREARTEADALRAEAIADRERAKSEMDSLVSRASAGIDADLLSEVARLHGVRATLEADIERLQTWLEEQRATLRHLLVDAMNVIEGSPLPIAEAPQVDPVDPEVRLGSVPLPASSDDRPTAAVAAVEADDGSDTAPP
jgi:cell division initiation protein